MTKSTTPIAGQARTTSVRFDVREFMDGNALSGVRISAQAVLRTERTLDFVPVPDDASGRGPGGGAARERPRERLTAPDFENAETKTAVSAADGTVTITWDPARDAQFAAGWDAITKRNVDLIPWIEVRSGFTMDAATAPDLFPLRQRIQNGGDARVTFRVDLVATIVGHVTDTTARLWFQPAPVVVRGGWTMSLVVSVRGRPLRRRLPRILSTRSSTHPHAVADVSRLQPGTDYEYHVVVTDGRSQWVSGRGWFRTDDPASPTVRIAFGSCHDPRRVADVERWKAMREWEPDVTVLLGDQIYGDGQPATAPATSPTPWPAPPPVASPPTAGQWAEWYGRAYRRDWRFGAVREALRRNATYMMHDDHDITDDWGTAFTTIDLAEQLRVRAAQDAFDAYQHAHNPLTPHRRTTDDPYDYSFRRGPVACYVLDERMRRGIEAADPVLGAGQWARLQAWARSAEVATADVIVLASPVPLVFCDVGRAEAVIKTWNTAIDLVEGVGGPLADAVSAVGEITVGVGLDDLKAPEAGGTIIEPDLADQWGHRKNRAELRRLLDLLFELQNDPSRQRAVIVISGDAHVSATHSILTFDSRHRSENYVIYQLISSPIGKEPSGTLQRAIEAEHDVFGSFSPTGDSFASGYHVNLLDSSARRSFGSLVVRRRPGPGRVYEIRGALQYRREWPLFGDETRLDLLYDLDARSPASPLRPEVTAVRTRSSGSS